MGRAFVIMQIGDIQLDQFYYGVLEPIIRECNLAPIRIDKHNEGGILKSEITKHIESSDIIVADLTNERPNCYLEVGYAMGIGKYRNLILIVNEDHFHESPNYKKGGPKIHFDLIGYDILFWDLNDIGTFKNNLKAKILRRLATLPDYGITTNVTESPAFGDWTKELRENALIGLDSSGRTSYMEICMTVKYKFDSRQRELLTAANKAQIHTFGWPIGIVMTKDEYKPRPTADGIICDFGTDQSYDFWSLLKNGNFYLLKSLFEDDIKPGYLFFDTRIVRIAETLLYAVRLYSELRVPLESDVHIKITHGGLKGLILASASPRRRLLDGRKCVEDKISAEIHVPLFQIEKDLVDLVDNYTSQLFAQFDFFELGKEVLTEIVNNFVEGKIS